VRVLKFCNHCHEALKSSLGIESDAAICLALAMKAFQDLAQSSRAGDTCVLHYSGHGGNVRDVSGDEPDRRDETLVSLDVDSAGQIIDDDLFKALAVKIPKGALLMCLMDSCHSGTVLDLPYKFVAGDKQREMTLDAAFKMNHLHRLASKSENVV
jgi:hypothetical protein